jgi:hypothetical protein
MILHAMLIVLLPYKSASGPHNIDPNNSAINKTVTIVALIPASRSHSAVAQTDIYVTTLIT